MASAGSGPVKPQHMQHIAGRLIQRTLFALSLLLALVLVGFVLFAVLPGDTARIRLGPNATEATVAILRADLGLNNPWHVRLIDHLSELGQLNLGKSLIDGRDIATEIIEKTAVTLHIGLLAAFLSLGLSYIANVLAYLNHRLRFIPLIFQGGVIFPSFFAAVVAVIATAYLFPQIPLSRIGTPSAPWYSWLVPATFVALYPLALLTRLLQQGLMAQAKAPHALAAKAWGYGKLRLFHSALLRPAAVPWLAGWFNQLGTLLVATLVVEVIFTIPGLGQLLISAIQLKDFPLLQGVVLVMGASFIIMFWLHQFLTDWVDPRVRT